MIRPNENIPILDWNYVDEEVGDSQMHEELVHLSRDEIDRYVIQLGHIVTGNYTGTWPAYKRAARAQPRARARARATARGRFMHSIKNDAVSCGFARFADVCHRYEAMGAGITNAMIVGEILPLVQDLWAKSRAAFDAGRPAMELG